jgi:tyrosine-protein phosphatase SIW14
MNRRALTTSLLAASLAFLPALGVAAPAPAANAVASRISIDNFGQVSATYFRGAQPDASDFADLAAAGVKTVIDLQADGNPGEGRLVESAGMKFKRIAMSTRVAPTPEQISEFLKLVNDPANQPVYVHCAGGRHRTGVMTAVYRMTHDGWNSDQAFKEMKQFKFGADFLHPEFKKFVYAYRTGPKPTAPVLALTTPAVVAN